MACILLRFSTKRQSTAHERRTVNSARLFVCAPGHLSAMFLRLAVGLCTSESVGRTRESHLMSSRPHHTPTPATDPGFPFPLHAPSEYTTSQPDSSSMTSVVNAAHLDVLELLARSWGVVVNAGLEYGFVPCCRRDGGFAGAEEEEEAAEGPGGLETSFPTFTPCWERNAVASCIEENFWCLFPAKPVICFWHSSL